MRSRILKGIVLALFAVLFVGLAHIQLVRSEAYRVLSERNIVRVMPIEAPRGMIFDRNGRLAVTNKLSFDVAVIYREIYADREKAAGLLSDVLGIPAGGVEQRLDTARDTPFSPVVIFRDIGKERAIILEERLFDVSGIVIESKAQRNYLFDNRTGHLFGHLGELTDKELDRLTPYGYRMKDRVGRSGLEASYNTYLTGKSGGQVIEVDSKGHQISVIGLKEPSHGKDLYTTIDINLQQAADEALGERSGVIIIMNPVTGEVLAMTSHPSFNPSTFIQSDASSSRARLLSDKRYPMLNRAVAGIYPPGSVFKVVVAAAALESKKVDEWKRFYCKGFYKLGGRKFRCWLEEGHGWLNIRGGIKNSCNVFFFKLGQTIGVDTIEAYANRFGFGRPTGIDLPGEVSGLVPGRLWKRLRKREAWYEGETLNYAIGQGYLLTTPFQVVRMMSAIANGGNLVRPFIVSRIGSTDIAGVKSVPIGISKKTIALLTDSLIKVVNDTDGTGRMARVDGFTVAGKTGTAQNPSGAPHSWFCGFAPARNPKTALVVFLEHGGKGGLGAAQLAKILFEKIRDEGYI